MKKTLYSLMALATLLFAASCAKEPANVADPALGGKPVKTTFTVSLGDALTKADPATSALDDGTLADQLYVAAFGPDGALISTSKVDGSIPVRNKSAEVTLTLTKNTTYKLVFFAQKTGTYDVNFADGNVATFSYGPNKTYNANDASLDAFFKTMSFTAGNTKEQSVELTRPFAQINVLVPVAALPDGKNAYSSTMTVTGAPTSFNLFTGEAVASDATAAPTVTFADAAITADSFGKYAETATAAKWIAMNYVLVPESGMVNVSFQETDMTEAMTLTDIAIKVNGRTNLVGDVYQLAGDYTFNVVINPVFDSEGEGSLDAEDTEILINNGQSYTANSPLAIVKGETKSVTVSINDETISAVNGYAGEGNEVTVESSDEDVATAAIDGNNVVITPVGDGEAVISVSTPAYTKANYKAGVAKIYVSVSGFVVEPTEPELTVEGAPADGAPVSEPLSLTVTTNSDGDLSWTVDPTEAGTVAAGEKDTEYIFTPADNLTENTPVTVTFTVAATETYSEKSEDVEFTVAAAEGGEEPTDEYYIKVTAAPMDWSGQYLLVYEEGGLALDGSLATLDAIGNTIEVVIEDDQIAVTDDTEAAEITIAKMEGGYSLQAASGTYFGGKNDTNTLVSSETAILNTLGTAAAEAEAGGFDIVSIGTYFRYNAASNQTRFRYYKATSYANQKPVALYKRGGSTGPVDPTVTATLTVTPASLNLLVDETETLSATTNSTAKPTFESSDATVATVDATGKVTAVAAGTATITVSVAAVEGAFTAASKTVAVTVEEPVADPYQKVTSITSGKTYVLVGKKGDKYYAATPLASGKTYGRLNGHEVSVSEDAINVDMADYEFTITAVTGGYTIAMPDGRILACDTEHDGTFQISDNLDHVFTAEFQKDGTVKFVHAATKKTFYHGGGTFTNFSCASTVPDDGTMLILFSK